MQYLMPKPRSLYNCSGPFSMPPVTNIKVAPSAVETRALGRYLAVVLLQITRGRPILEDGLGNNQLTFKNKTGLGAEGYGRSITTDSIQIIADCPGGWLYGLQSFLKRGGCYLLHP